MCARVRVCEREGELVRHVCVCVCVFVYVCVWGWPALGSLKRKLQILEER